MLLAYLDESGDTGLGSPTNYFVLGAVLVPDHRWTDVLNRHLATRRVLQERWRFPGRAELRASDAAVGSGAFRPYRRSPEDRRALLHQVLDDLARFPVSVFAVALDKRRLEISPTEIRETAWRFLLQRIHRSAAAYQTTAMLLPDAGTPHPVRLVRKLRRHHQVPAFERPEEIRTEALDRIIEDPLPRASAVSWLIQLADLVAYAAHRSRYLDPKGFLDDGWDRLADVHLEEVNRTRGGPPGIVLWPE